MLRSLWQVCPHSRHADEEASCIEAEKSRVAACTPWEMSRGRLVASRRRLDDVVRPAVETHPRHERSTRESESAEPPTKP